MDIFPLIRGKTPTPEFQISGIMATILKKMAAILNISLGFIYPT